MNMPTPFAEPQPVLLTVEDFGALVDAGAFAEYGKTELIEGVVVHMNAEHSRGAFLRMELAFRFRDALLELSSPYVALSEPSIAMPPRNVPRPDVGITNAKPDDSFFPLSTMALLVEVSDTTLRFDLGRKRSIYAGAGVPEYWVVGVRDKIVRRFWSPREGRFSEEDETPLEDELRLHTMPELAIDERGIL